MYVINEAEGVISFSSNLANNIITLKYVSDGLGSDEDTKVHKFAEEAIYKHIALNILSSKSNIQEYVINRFKKERKAAMRNAKLRIQGIRPAEFIQIMRNKSKQIKH